MDKRLRLYDDYRGLDSDPAAFRKRYAGRKVSAARGISGKEKRVTLRETVEMKGRDGSNPTLSAHESQVEAFSGMTAKSGRVGDFR